MDFPRRVHVAPNVVRTHPRRDDAHVQLRNGNGGRGAPRLRGGGARWRRLRAGGGWTGGWQRQHLMQEVIYLFSAGYATS